MRKLPLLLPAVLLLASGIEAKPFGIGLVLGEPTGISVKYFLNRTTALDAGVAWGWGIRGWGYPRGYTDNRCYEPGFYNANAGYCRNQRYDTYYDRYGPYDYRGFHFHADYLVHNYKAIRSRVPFPLFYGPGVSVEFFRPDVTQLGARGVIGIAWFSPTETFEAFFELAPVLQLVPATWLDVNGGIGGRFYF